MNWKLSHNKVQQALRSDDQPVASRQAGRLCARRYEFKTGD